MRQLATTGFHIDTHKTFPTAITMLMTMPAEHSLPGSGRICQFLFKGKQCVVCVMMAAIHAATEIPATACT